MKTAALCASFLVAMIGPAPAQDLSVGLDSSVGLWGNRNGGSGFSTNYGIDGIDQRRTGRIALSLATDLGPYVGQVDLAYQGLEPPNPNLHTDDATDFMVDATLRLMRDYGPLQAGLFLGQGLHDDYGDSDETMGYGFFGLDLAAESGPATLFAQIGRLDSFDDQNEGTQDASFLRLGASRDIGGGYTLTGAVFLARGLKYAVSPLQIEGAEIGVERHIAATPYTLYARYDHTQIVFTNGSDFGDTFNTLWVGVKMDLGGQTRRGGRLPDFGQWVAYNANEIE